MRLLLFFAFLLAAMPAFAAGTNVPEPSNLALFAMGVIGVLLGRQGAKRRAGKEGTGED